MVKSPRNFELRSVASTALTLFYYGKSFGSWTIRQGVAGTVHYKYLPLCWFVSFLDFSSKTSTQWEGKMSWTRSQRFVNLVENYSYVSSSVNLDANLLCVNTQQIYWPKGVVRFNTDFAKKQISIFLYFANSLGRFTDSSAVASLWALVASCVQVAGQFACLQVGGFPQRSQRVDEGRVGDSSLVVSSLSFLVFFAFTLTAPTLFVESSTSSESFLNRACFFTASLSPAWLIALVKDKLWSTWSYFEGFWSCRLTTVCSRIITSFRVP